MSCKQCPHCEEKERRKKPKVFKAFSNLAGNCNFCMRNDDPGYVVIVVQSPAPCGLIVRVCDRCIDLIQATK